MDLQPVTGSFQGSPVHLLQGDVAELSDETLVELGLDPSSPFDVLLSDMAPATTGSRDTDHYGSMRLCHLVLDLAATRLAPGGDLVMKMFEGPGSKDLLDRAREMFETVRPAKPKAAQRTALGFLYGSWRIQHDKVGFKLVFLVSIAYKQIHFLF